MNYDYTYYCNKCKQHQRASKKIQLYNIPNFKIPRYLFYFLFSRFSFPYISFFI